MPPFKINISVDGDTLRHYANFSPNVRIDRDPLMTHTIPRMLDLFAALDIRVTFFAVAETLAENGPLWRRIAEAGHEVASHSYSHVQAFHLLSRDEKKREIGESKRIIEDCTGKVVEGFRAPAYNLDAEALDLLIENGYRYDSSLYPGWYVIASKIVTRLLSRNYRPIPTSPFYLWHWRRPSRPFWWEIGNRRLLEIPLPTTRFMKPFFGTLHLNASRRFFTRELSWLTRKRRVITYELHPMEVADEVVIGQAQWVRNIPGVGKHADPWEHLSFRLKALKHSGDLTLLRDVGAEGAQTFHLGT